MGNYPYLPRHILDTHIAPYLYTNKSIYFSLLIVVRDQNIFDDPQADQADV